jgi:SAM-dependent methyltransferase
MALTLTHQAHQIIRDHFDAENVAHSFAIDATCGNGHDTLFLLELGFAQLVGFDIQDRALLATQERCKNYSVDRLTLVNESHSMLAETIHDLKLSSHKLSCVVFNLGYLPSGDKAIATQSRSTLEALDQACSALANGGLISLLCYPGHPHGVEETADLIQALTNLDISGAFTLRRYDSERASATTPVLLTLEKHAN